MHVNRGGLYVCETDSEVSRYCNLLEITLLPMQYLLRPEGARPPFEP